MEKLLIKQRKVISFSIYTLWIPPTIFGAHLLLYKQSNSLFYYLIVSLLLFFILLTIGEISKRLERSVSSEDTYVSRMVKQFLYGFIVPLFAVVTLMAIYIQFINSNANLSSNELGILIAYLYMANSFYLVVHMETKLCKAKSTREGGQRYHAKIVVYHQGIYSPINLFEIGLIDQRNQINWLITLNEEEHILDLSLNEIQLILDPKLFFKINRNQIINKEAIGRFRSGSFGKIELTLNVCQIKGVVSKDRAKDFIRWFYQ